VTTTGHPREQFYTNQALNKKKKQGVHIARHQCVLEGGGWGKSWGTCEFDHGKERIYPDIAGASSYRGLSHMVNMQGFQIATFLGGGSCLQKRSGWHSKEKELPPHTTQKERESNRVSQARAGKRGSKARREHPGAPKVTRGRGGPRKKGRRLRGQASWTEGNWKKVGGTQGGARQVTFLTGEKRKGWSPGHTVRGKRNWKGKGG